MCAEVFGYPASGSSGIDGITVTDGVTTVSTATTLDINGASVNVGASANIAEINIGANVTDGVNTVNDVTTFSFENATVVGGAPGFASINIQQPPNPFFFGYTTGYPISVIQVVSAAGAAENATVIDSSVIVDPPTSNFIYNGTTSIFLVTASLPESGFYEVELFASFNQGGNNALSLALGYKAAGSGTFQTLPQSIFPADTQGNDFQTFQSKPVILELSSGDELVMQRINFGAAAAFGAANVAMKITKVS